MMLSFFATIFDRHHDAILRHARQGLVTP